MAALDRYTEKTLPGLGLNDRQDDEVRSLIRKTKQNYESMSLDCIAAQKKLSRILKP